MRHGKPVLLALLLLLSACDGGTGAADPSWFRASVSGGVSREYEGTGDFAVLRDFAESPYYFKIHSDGLDSVVQESFFIRWPTSTRPAPGTYPLVSHADDFGSSAGVTATYSWDRGDNVTEPYRGELYVATGGVIEITTSTGDEVEGTVRFSGILVEKAGVWGTEFRRPRYAPDPTAPTIEVGGSFRLTRFDPDNVVVRNTH